MNWLGFSQRAAATLLIVGAAGLGCSLTTSDGPTGDPGVRQAEALFGVPTEPTADPANIYGVWETNETRTDGVDITSRFQLRADSIVVATRCFLADAPRVPRYGVIVSVSSPAVVTPETIDIAESHIEGFHIREDQLCGVRIISTRPLPPDAPPDQQKPPAPLGACKESSANCFTFGAAKLAIVLAGTRYEMTKIAD